MSAASLKSWLGIGQVGNAKNIVKGAQTKGHRVHQAFDTDKLAFFTERFLMSLSLPKMNQSNFILAYQEARESHVSAH